MSEAHEWRNPPSVNPLESLGIILARALHIDRSMTYSEAVRILNAKKSSAGTLRWDAGAGWTSEAFYCARRKRIIFTSINPSGLLVVS